MVQLHELFLMVFIFACVKMIFKYMLSWRIISASLILLSTFLFCNAAALYMAVSSAIYSSTSQAPRTTRLHAMTGDGAWIDIPTPFLPIQQSSSIAS